jgi:hypothetical protein
MIEGAFLWNITDLTPSGLEVLPDPGALAVVEQMRPGDYLVIPGHKAREILHVEIAERYLYLETADLEKHRSGDDKGQVVGSETWPFDIPIMDFEDETLFDGQFDGVPVKIIANELFIEMSGQLIFGYNFDIIPPDIMYLLWEFDSDLVVTIDYTTEVGGAIDHDFDLLTFSIPVYTVGWATINVDIALPTELTTDGPVCIGGGLSFDFGYSIGFQVLGDEVDAIWTSAPGNFSDVDPAYGAEANANIKTTVDVGVSATIGIPNVLEVASAAFDIAIYANTIGVEDPCVWALDSGVSSNLAITEFTGLLCGPGECDWQLFDASIYSDNRTCDNLTDNCACNDMVCPTGCCAANACEPGTADNACGITGDACVVCGGDQHCVEGTCVAACDAQLCPTGCCDGVICKAGDSDDQCGTGGAECAACGEHEQCNDQQCVTLCDSYLCPLGCCADKQCKPGDSNLFCGTDGEDCQTCGAGTHCEDGECLPGVDDDDNDDNDDNDNDDNDTADDDNDTADDDDDDNDDNDNNDDNDDIYADDDESPTAQDDDDDSGGCGC